MGGQSLAGIQWPGTWWLGLPPQDWPNVSGTPNTIQKALRVVGENLRKAQHPWGCGGCGLGVSALQAEMKTALHDEVKFLEP